MTMVPAAQARSVAMTSMPATASAARQQRRGVAASWVSGHGEACEQAVSRRPAPLGHHAPRGQGARAPATLAGGVALRRTMRCGPAQDLVHVRREDTLWHRADYGI
jgi:hypothetical protein